jgi:hypothetical protein
MGEVRTTIAFNEQVVEGPPVNRGSIVVSTILTISAETEEIVAAGSPIARNIKRCLKYVSIAMAKHRVVFTSF